MFPKTEIPNNIEGVEIPEDAVVVVLGANWDKSRINEGVELSTASKLGALAAYIMDQVYKVETIIFSTGPTNSRYHTVSEARAMFDYVKSFGLFFNNDVCLEEESYDTHSNADKVYDLLEEKELAGRPIVIIAAGFHCRRAKQIFGYRRRANLACVLSSEEILQKTLRNTQFYTKEVQPLIKAVGNHTLQEALIRGVTFFDRKGNLAKRFTRRRINQ